MATYTAMALNTGGRDGHFETTDHSVSANFSSKFCRAIPHPGEVQTPVPARY